MLRIVGCVTEQHDARLVVAAGLVCMLACFTTVSMLWRSSAHQSLARAAWHAASAFVFGCGVWTTHFVAILAFRSDVPVGYAAGETALSLIVVCAGAWVSFWVFLHWRRQSLACAGAGLLLGASVGAMHFVGAHAMRAQGLVSIEEAYVIGAILLGMAWACPALVIAQRLEYLPSRICSCVLLSLAILGLHFTGMTGTAIEPGTTQAEEGLVFGTALLATIVIAAAGTILILSLLGSLLDQYLSLRTVREQRNLQHIALHDSLTGLPNRLAFRQGFEQILGEANAGSAACAVLCLDLDRFKLINDLYGHQVGDSVLTIVAARLRSLTRSNDVVARISGDEFVVAMAPNTDADAAGAMAGRLVSALAVPMLLEGQQICIGASIGIATYPLDGTNATDLLRNADLALYEAKRSGRNTHCFFEPKLDEKVRYRQQMERDLRRAIEVGEFQLHYQPLVEIKTDAVVGYEALVRWNHPSRGLVSPGEFIPIAEESGLIVPLGRWVLETACQEATIWPEPMGVSVNVSPIQFQQPDLAQMVIDILTRIGLRPNRLDLELTESVLLHHPEQALETLNKLRGHGIKLSLDDFGTGYSSLSYLRRFPFTKLKIDRSFVQDLGEGKEAGVLARAIVAMGHSLGLEVTAEGVETEEQYRFLEAEDCNQVQGYLLGKPVPADQLGNMQRVGVHATSD